MTSPPRPRPHPAGPLPDLPRSRPRESSPGPDDGPPRRFRDLDDYRVEREWRRYEGTAQRRLFRELRSRFLARHRVPRGWSLDLGSGPGRFLRHLGGEADRRVALDLSLGMLSRIPPDGPDGAEAVRGDGLRPPFAPRSFAEVVALGNVIGFAASRAEELLTGVLSLAAPGGIAIVEIVAGPGERSRYLGRLPPTALARLLRAPVPALLPRVDREGFAREPVRRREPGTFRRVDPARLRATASASGAVVLETMAVAPALGADPARLEAVALDPAAWAHLLDLEEAFGHRTERQLEAAALLVALTTPLDTHD